MGPTDILLAHFEKISSIPRGYKVTKAGIRQWLIDWFQRTQFQVQDRCGGESRHLCPASSGRESSPTLILQRSPRHGLAEDSELTPRLHTRPIRLMRDGDWLKADETTLGADNGIASAFMMALVEDESVLHPPLELLLTVERNSASWVLTISTHLLSGKTLINLDSEEEGVFTIWLRWRRAAL